MQRLIRLHCRIHRTVRCAGIKTDLLGSDCSSHAWSASSHLPFVMSCDGPSQHLVSALPGMGHPSPLPPACLLSYGWPCAGRSTMMLCCSCCVTGNRLASGSDDTCIGLWDVDQGKLLRMTPTGHTANIFCVKFLPQSGVCSSTTGPALSLATAAAPAPPPALAAAAAAYAIAILPRL